MGVERQTTRFSNLPAVYDGLARLWILRSMVKLGGQRTFISRTGFSNDLVAAFLEVDHLEKDFSVDRPVALKLLCQMHDRAEQRMTRWPGRTAMAQNIDWLGGILGLSTEEKEILHFLVVVSNHRVLRLALNELGGLSFSGVQHLLSKLLDLPLRNVEQATHPLGVLTSSGLLNIDLDNQFTLDGKISLVSGLADMLGVQHKDRFQVFRGCFRRAAKGKLTRADFPHLKTDLTMLEAYMREALDSARPGVNILVHGVPGSGKTEFARMLSQQLGCTLFEVAAEGFYGTPLQGPMRFRAFRLSQALLRRTPGHLILFDEVEDVFPEQGAQPPNGSEAHGLKYLKGWINQMLEENPVPTFWVTNSLAAIDPAYLRRFDFVLEVGTPPRSVRAKILDTYLRDLSVSPELKAEWSGNGGLMPAVVERAAKVVKAIRRSDPSMDVGAAFSRIAGNTLEAMGMPREARACVLHVTDYRPELLNTDCDLASVRSGLQREGRGRLCFFGPSGTGKTAYGRYLAEELDRPLIVRRASDLQSPWVGVAEKNMARMFEEARQENAVLVLDEADSFLQDRKGAQQSWEVSQVNEMLTQMETFEGIFIASTNLMESLDEAALRRFDLKVRFDYLKLDQACAMFLDASKRLGLEACAPVHARAWLRSIPFLTPGDFATAIRQARLNPISSMKMLAERLRFESETKPQGRRRTIGF